MQNRDIMEFYIERSMLPRGISGDYGHLPQFSGKIISIEQYVESDADVEEAMKREHLNKERMKNIKKEEKEKKKKEKEKKKAEKKKKKEEEKKKKEEKKKEKNEKKAKKEKEEKTESQTSEENE